MTAAEYFRLSLAGTPLVDNFANYFASSYNFVALIANAIAAYTVQHVGHPSSSTSSTDPSIQYQGKSISLDYW
jgi:hypothetical protein